MKFEPGAKLGPYQILGELGRGGMATVYRAYQPSLEREVAIKILPEFLVEQPGFKARFHREAVAVARLQHPNILSVFDHGEQDGTTYIVSEYVEGGTLASRMGAPIQLDYCVRILRPIADALDYAHSEGVIHRDVKPSNILLDRRGVPILSDFGLARVSDEGERLTQTGAMVGTPTYMAPEQCSGGEVGPPADIYALAVIAYEMATGRVPFSGTNPLSVIAAQQLTPPPSPRKFNPSLPASVEQPLLAGLAKDAARRPETATDFIDALAAALPSPGSQYPMTPQPAMPSPPTPTAIEPPPAPSYPSVAAPISSPPPQYSPPPFAPQSYPQAPAPPSYPAAAPYATAAATPPPSYPPMAPQPQYTPAPAYASAPQQQLQWAAPQPARREGAAGWVLIALWVGFAVAVLIAAGAIIEPFNTALDGTARGTWAALGVVGVIAATLSIAAALGLAARDRWAGMAGWGSVAALAVSVIASPVAAAVAVGLVQAPRGSLVAPQSKPGSGMRIGAPLVAGAVVLLVLAGTTVIGWSSTPSATPTATVTPTPTACNVLTAGTQITKSAIGTDCGFSVKSTVVQLDCRSVTALPGALKALSYDDNTSGPGGNATFTMDSAGCHMLAPTKQLESDLASTSALDPGPTMLVADFLIPQSDTVIGLLFGCDDTSSAYNKCIQVNLESSSSSVYVWDDDTQLISQTISPAVGPNRLMAVIQGEQIRVWFNGKLVATESAKRLHGSGTYLFFAANTDDKKPLEAIVQQFAVYTLTK